MIRLGALLGGLAAGSGEGESAAATQAAPTGGPGISPEDVQAANNPGGLTDANTPTTINSLGLDIE